MLMVVQGHLTLMLMVGAMFVPPITVLLLICVILWLPLLNVYTEYVDPSGLTAFTACQLIALDKHPGVWPIGVGEVVQRNVGKTVLSVIGVKIKQSAGSLQLCAG